MTPEPQPFPLSSHPIMFYTATLADLEINGRHLNVPFRSREDEKRLTLTGNLSFLPQPFFLALKGMKEGTLAPQVVVENSLRNNRREFDIVATQYPGWITCARQPAGHGHTVVLCIPLRRKQKVQTFRNILKTAGIPVPKSLMDADIDNIDFSPLIADFHVLIVKRPPG